LIPYVSMRLILAKKDNFAFKYNDYAST